MLLGVVLDMGALGFWLGSAIAGYTYLVVGGPYYLSGKWRNLSREEVDYLKGL